MKKILIADDSMIARTGLSRLIKELNLEFISASNGQEAVDLNREFKPALILLDLLMPVMTGQEALKQIKSETPDTPVIILSADIQETTKIECKTLGANEFLNKPPSKDMLIAIIEKYLD